MFARCRVCDNKRLLCDLHVVGLTNYTIFNKAYKMHLEKHEAYHNPYYGTHHMSISKLEKCLTIIHDKMGHAKMVSPWFASKTKNTNVFMRFSVAITGMVAHGHGDVKFAHFSLDLYPGDSNCTNGSIAKLLHDLEKPPISLSRVLFVKPLFLMSC
jgi:hypothetical protein